MKGRTMNRHIGQMLLSAGLGLALQACSPTYPNCKSDEHCKEHNEVCVEGQCKECAGDQNCKPGFICQGNRCVPKPECNKDADCGAGKSCQGGKCVAHECEADKDCPAGSKCRNNSCIQGACSTNEDCPGGQECLSGTCVAKADKCNWTPVHFGFNESSLTNDVQSQLKDLADCIKGQKLTVRLEGHADERGTEEYNLQLSQRRAAAVMKYLTDLGIQKRNLSTVGYGKNRPAVDGHDETAWTANRPVEFNKH
jgi:peptidoglycan-associated lipoprotein